MKKSFLERYQVALGAGALLIIGALAVFLSASIPPRGFPEGGTFNIRKGMTLGETAEALEAGGYIRSPFAYKSYAMIFARGKIVAGEYLFNDSESALKVAMRTVTGRYGQPKIRVTLPEGTDVAEMAWILLKNLPRFDAPRFLSLAKSKEGFLFPDTYYFYPAVQPEEVIAKMESVFKSKTTGLEARVKASGRSFEDVITMASILEREAANSEDRRIIAGILWKRLDAKMPLQVDASFWYLFRKPSSVLTTKDLQIDSPYNTYKYRGLPPGPISNPGFEAIEDTLAPVSTKYWYYLSDEDGVMHYSATLEEHAENKRKYL